MPNSNYTSQAQEEKLRSDYLAGRTFSTVNVNTNNSSGGGKKFTFDKFNNIVQQIAQGLNAASMYNSPGYRYGSPGGSYYTPQPPVNQQTSQKSGFPLLLGVVIVGAGIAMLVKTSG